MSGPFTSTMDLRAAEEVETRKQCCYSTPFSMEVIRKQLNIVIDLHTIEYCWYWSSAYEITYEIYIQLNIKVVSSSLSKKSAQLRNSRKKEKKVDVWWTSCVSAHCKPDGRVSIFGVGHHFCANTWQPYPYIPGQKAMGGHSCQFLLYILIKKPNPSASVWNISYPGL